MNEVKRKQGRKEIKEENVMGEVNEREVRK